MKALDIRLQSSGEMREEERNSSIEKERDFWLKKAETLHGHIEAIYEHARSGDNSPIRIMRRGVEITLYVRKTDEPKPQT